MTNKVHVNYIPSFLKSLLCNRSLGMVHPLYMCSFSFCFAPLLLNCAHFSSQYDLCFFERQTMYAHIYMCPFVMQFLYQPVLPRSRVYLYSRSRPVLSIGTLGTVYSAAASK